MAASDPKLKWSGDIYGVQSEDGRTFRTVYREIWTVLLDKDDHTSIASSADGLPALRDASSFNSYLRVSSKNARRVSPLMAEVDVDYSSNTNGDGDNQDPTLLPAKVRVSAQDVEIGFDHDGDGKRVSTIVGEPYRGLMTVETQTVITVSRALAFWDGVKSVQFANKTNADEFAGFEPGTILCKGFDSENMDFDGLVYFQVTGRFISRDPYPGRPASETWWKRVLRAGLYCYVIEQPGDFHFRERCLDSNGLPSTVPMVLNDDGTQKDLGIEFDKEDTDCWDYFKEFGETNFADIGFF